MPLPFAFFKRSLPWSHVHRVPSRSQESCQQFLPRASLPPVSRPLFSLWRENLCEKLPCPQVLLSLPSLLHAQKRLPRACVGVGKAVPLVWAQCLDVIAMIKRVVTRGALSLNLTEHQRPTPDCLVPVIAMEVCVWTKARGCSQPPPSRAPCQPGSQPRAHAACVVTGEIMSCSDKYRQKEIKPGNMSMRDERAGVGDTLQRAMGRRAL